jgi:peroxiredoxin
VVLLTVSADPREKTDAFSHWVHAPFSMLSDPGLRIINAWGVREEGKKIAAPCMFLVGPGGVVLWRYLGKNMTDRPGIDRILGILDLHAPEVRRPRPRNSP